jgi:hypothetical protein
VPVSDYTYYYLAQRLTKCRYEKMYFFLVFVMEVAERHTIASSFFICPADCLHGTTQEPLKGLSQS